MQSSPSQRTYQKNFYFIFEHKIQFIPHIEEQIKKFIAKHEPKISSMDSNQKAALVKAIQNKIKKLQEFYQQKYVDYRAHLVLRSTKLLHQFMSRNNDELIPEIPEVAIETKTSLKSNNRATSPKEKNLQSPLNIKKGMNRKIVQTYNESPNQKKKLKTQSSRGSQGKINERRERVSQEKTKINSFRIQGNIEEEHEEQVRKQQKEIKTKRAQLKVEPTKKMSKSEYIQYLKKKKN